MKHVHFLLLFILFGLSCSEPELVLDNELDPENPDFIPPETTILSPFPIPGLTITDNMITIHWEGNNDSMEFQHQLDGNSWSAWNKNKYTSFNYLDEGEHAFLIRGRHLSGMEEELPDTLQFSVNAIDGPSLRIFPLFTEIPNGEDFNVEVWAEEVVNVAAMEIVLRYELQKLEIEEDDIAIGDFFSSNGGSILNFSSIEEEGDYGEITINIGVYSGDPESVSGSRPVISITPTAIMSGTTDLELLEGDIICREPDNDDIEIEDTVNGVVVVQ